MTIDEAKTYLEEFKNLNLPLTTLRKDTSKIIECLTAAIKTAFIDSPKIEIIPSVGLGLVHLKVKKVHILIGVYTLMHHINNRTGLTIRILRDIDKFNFTHMDANAYFAWGSPVEIKDVTFDALVETIVDVYSKLTEELEEKKAAKNENAKIKAKLIQMKEQLNQELQIKVNTNKELTLNINNIDVEKIERLLQALKAY